MPEQFVPARQLSAAFYAEVVRPVLGSRPHEAALLGWDSDVLGYDTERSTDHGWGPRLLVFVSDDDAAAQVLADLDERLPDRFRGHRVRLGWDDVAANHHVTVTTLRGWLLEQLGIDPTDGMTVLDWLVTPQQRLLGVVAGAVHADPAGRLAAVRRSLAWYPDQLTAGRLVRDVMRLALLLGRHYAPYQKWLGTTFARSGHPDDLPGHLARAVHARDVRDRESALADA
ncbi:DUF4037 domain-containing protein [Pseudonocardia nigra]|uniref:DUF4037 domain-containing protein n=1 Tax=Pseudonocardia nigra TaxID=1921578 RepID=UPI001C5E1B34|nr:DUF4037 domain-containing protein [Pseudonocardia nigra]